MNSSVSTKLSLNRSNIIEYIDSIIVYKIQLESLYTNAYLLTEFVNYCNKNNNIVNDTLHEIIQKDLNKIYSNINTLVLEIKNLIVMLKSIIKKI
ncbi:hypothetical protein YKV026c [Yokapox virus]|uniref:Uncharacterized protein n=1 Tax=Yokapox virus TaxID=1076255 RepID=G3EIA4_9POXV|nr:hypothetical protein YKV026c [Yokapox virus]AEN03615.1 hypothetical protein YKV026c [Yokapox virus]